MEWIKVEERLPELKQSGVEFIKESDWCLAYTSIEMEAGPCGPFIGFLYKADGEEPIWTSSEGWEPAGVTHWMPMPKRPDE